MKVLALLLLPFLAYSQSTDFPAKSERLAMSETFQSAPNVYHKKGEDKPFTGVLYARYDNGELMSMQEHVDGKGNGKWINYDPDGRKTVEGTMVNNKVEGPAIFYYEDGSIKAKGNYMHWKKQIGEWIYYDRKGNEVSRMVFTR